ncbi:hypothetical protein, partial [Dactylosporangium fulvum]|uniref:hypothetical protein n=1 Tax=Dactylosporangium fulvum TaxID=53359 RepID=UPI0031DD0E4F
ASGLLHAADRRGRLRYRAPAPDPVPWTDLGTAAGHTVAGYDGRVVAVTTGGLLEWREIAPIRGVEKPRPRSSS